MKKNQQKNIELTAGDLIEHTTQDFGQGRVMEVKDGVATISFKKAGKKRFPVGSRYLVQAETAETPTGPSDESKDPAPEETPDDPPA